MRAPLARLLAASAFIVASAGPSLAVPIILLNAKTYSTSTAVAASPGITGGAGIGGLCVGGSPTGCPTGQTGTLTNGEINLSPIALTAGVDPALDSNYQLTFSVTDLTTTAGSYYELELDGIPFYTTPTVTPGGGTKSSGTGSIVLRGAQNPGTQVLGVTNLYLDDTGSPLFSSGTFSLTVSESPAPEPASLGLFGAGVGMLAWFRRRRSTRAATGAGRAGLT